MKRTHLYSIAVVALVLVTAVSISLYQTSPAQVTAPSVKVVFRTDVTSANPGDTILATISLEPTPASTEVAGADITVVHTKNAGVTEKPSAGSAFTESAVSTSSPTVHLVRLEPAGVAGASLLFAGLNVVVTAKGNGHLELGANKAAINVVGLDGKSIPVSSVQAAWLPIN